jgi:hypothetical protein
VLGWSAVALAAGCEQSRTELVVRVDSELAWGARQAVQSVVLTVRRGGAAGPLRSSRTTALGTGGERRTLPLFVGVIAGDGDVETPVWIEALGCDDPNGCTAAEARVAQRAVVRFVRGQTQEVPLLLASACAGVTCASEQRCAAGGLCEAATAAQATVRPFVGVSMSAAEDATDGARDDATVTDGANDVEAMDSEADVAPPPDAEPRDVGERDAEVIPTDHGESDGSSIDLPDVGTAEDVPEASGEAGAADVGVINDVVLPSVDAGVINDVVLPPVDAGRVDAGPRCTPPLTECGPGTCVNIQSDAANCGACRTACAAGTVCAAGSCGVSNDARGSARVITLGASETTVTGTTASATHDGPTVPCGCTSGPNVWYRFTLAQREVVYLDTAGSATDTSLLVTDASGVAVPAQPTAGNTNLGLCNDDSGCGAGASGFTSMINSRTAGVLGAGTWFVAVGSCGAGAFTLRVQHLPTTLGSYFDDARLQGDNTTSTVLVGTSRIAGTCGGTASGENVRWFVTCGATTQFFSLCASDGGTYTRSNSTANFDPSMYIRSALTGSETACNDDGGTMGGSNCRGTGIGADSTGYGSRLNNVATARGLHGLVVDERSGGSGMSYTLRYIVR